MKIKTKQKETVKICLTLDELKLIYEGIGATSPVSRRDAGMHEEASDFFRLLYQKIHRGGFFG